MEEYHMLVLEMNLQNKSMDKLIATTEEENLLKKIKLYYKDQRFMKLHILMLAKQIHNKFMKKKMILKMKYNTIRIKIAFIIIK
jgi:hypothetical protein